jgi:hypothetical protein
MLTAHANPMPAQSLTRGHRTLVVELENSANTVTHMTSCSR